MGYARVGTGWESNGKQEAALVLGIPSPHRSATQVPGGSLPGEEAGTARREGNA